MSRDPSWDKIPSAIYGLVEINLGITCASVVTLRPLWHRVRRSLSNKADDTSQQTEIVMPEPHPVRRRRFSDDLVLMTGNNGTTQVGSSGGLDVELGETVHNHSDLSIARSNKTGEQSGAEGRQPEAWSPTPENPC